MTCEAWALTGVAGSNVNATNITSDSYGLQPPNEIVQYLKTGMLYSTDRIQPDGTAICGHLCIYVLNRFSHGEDMKLVINALY
jgi:hypothetical protein